ncbi:MAG TPA: tripartite tricarboxylate transporter permease [Desulfobacterales bacterium]|nr:tripartite tricarboxylate transporter permease [Desulfobacterales bacterium]
MGFEQILAEVLKTLNFEFISLIAIGVFIGLIVGALPGLTTTMGIALLTGITFKFTGHAAIALLMGLYVGGVSGGSLSAILIGIPGTPANASSIQDGFPLAMAGKAAQAITISRAASVMGTLFGIGCLAFFTPLLTELALKFTSAEFFLVGLFGVLISGSLTGSDLPLKGWIGGLFGLAIGMIGADELTAWQRMSFGSPELFGGVPFIPIMIGFFGIPQVVESLIDEQEVLVAVLDKSKIKIKEILKYWWVAIRSGLIGVGIGIIPGVGEDVASWTSYGVAKRASKHPEEYGKGSIEGLVAAETADNSCVGGAIIPLLSLGIPGSPPAAVLLGAFLIHGVRPGPMLSFEFPAFTYQAVSWLLVATLFMRLLVMWLARPMQKILQVKNSILMPIVTVLCAIGAYSLDIRFLDITLVFLAGLLGLLFKQGKYPAAPLVLGIVLGPLVDTNFRRALKASGGDFSIFFTRPVSLILVISIVVLILGQLGVFAKMAEVFKKNREAAE